MSVDVKYKGATITTVEARETKTLTTAGKYCEADIVLTDDSNPVAEDKDVIFIDYDGTTRYSYTKNEFLALTELPPNPTHAGLTAQGWNWTLADAKAYVADYGKLDVGQMYITDDGKTRIYIRLEEGRLAPYLGIAINGTATVDWGDGSTSTVTGTSTSTVISTQHTYAAAGDYVIAIAVSGSMALVGNSSYGAQVLWKNSTTVNLNRTYWNAIQKVEIGANTSIGTHAFYSCSSLTSITIPSGVTRIGNSAFYSCSSLTSITIPSGVTSTDNSALRYCYTLTSITIPSGVTSIDGQALRNCSALASITIPSGVTRIRNQAFQACYALTSITIPSGVKSIDVQAFQDCYGLGYVKFTRTTPPTVGSSNAWTGLPTDCIIYVPYASLAAYLTATNYPDPATYTYIGFVTYQSGATLPTQDSTQAYNVVWYASKADAIAQTNAITVGNGKEIYCRYMAV